MKVLYDYQAFTFQYFGGVSKYFCEILKHRPIELEYDIAIKETCNSHLIESGLISDLLPLIMDYNIFAKKYPMLSKHKIYKFLNRIGVISGAEKINKKESIRKIKEGNFDIFHATFFDDYFLPYIGNKPFVITVHDMMPEIYPQFFISPNPETIRKKKLCEKAASVIAVSENTKKDLMRIFNIPEKKIHVVYHGGPDKEGIHQKPIINGEYFLYVGQRDAYKNFTQTLIDFAKFSNLHNAVQLVCTGKPFSVTEIYKIKELNIEDKVLYYHPSDAEMKNLYAYAIAFVYPSLYEGFGMPILEAFAYGCPVLLNKKSCFPEIAGDAALYFESENGKSDLYEKLAAIYLNKNCRNLTILRQDERFRNFSWKKSAQEHYGVYSNIMRID